MISGQDLLSNSDDDELIGSKNLDLDVIKIFLHI